ncbi:hypothetical protein [Mobiluncus mulieris]|uniref:hypothetical protein n=1 Tax=Mobiluncus mulieris TaxID=2052 RepID=UPI002093C138|nr:hypothetical protein [Mobiluncus mulieris]
MSVGRSLILEMENTDESGAAGASRGAACDEVSAQVLVLNLPLEGTAPAVALAGATRTNVAGHRQTVKEHSPRRPPNRRG